MEQKTYAFIAQARDFGIQLQDHEIAQVFRQFKGDSDPAMDYLLNYQSNPAVHQNQAQQHQVPQPSY